MKKLVTLSLFFFVMNTAHGERFITKEVNAKEKECLAYNIYHEARSDSYEGMLAVATVTANRVQSRRYPNSYCEVVYQSARDSRTGKQIAQFSWTLNGKSHRPYNREAYQVALEISREVLLYGKRSDIICENTLNYHATYVRPYWATRLERVARVDTHIFYKTH